jgi:hypothetical protein
MKPPSNSSKPEIAVGASEQLEKAMKLKMEQLDKAIEAYN